MTSYYDIHVENELTKKNTFKMKPLKVTTVPSIEHFIKNTPRIAWSNNEETISCYNYAWKQAYSSLKPANDYFYKPFIDTCFNDHLFMWDSVFMMHFGKYAASAFPFFGTLDNLYQTQHSDGFICREIHEETGLERFERFDYSSTGPNLFAWIEWDRYQLTGDLERLKKVYPVITSYHQWLRNYRTWKDGTYFTSGWGSGMDNLPRQSAEYSPEFHHGFLSWIDMTAQQALSCDCLIKIAKEIDVKIPTDMEDEYHLLSVKIQEMWDEDTGFFYDKNRFGQLTKIMTIGSFWVMLSGLASVKQAKRMVEHLMNPSDFYTTMVIPGLASHHPLCDDNYWRGGVWAPTNYMVFKALERYGYYSEKHQLAKRYLQGIVQDYSEFQKLYEVYESKTGKHQSIARPDFVGWTGLAPITILIEDIFGIKLNYLHHELYIHIQEQNAYSIDQLHIGNDCLHIAYQPENEQAFIRVTSNELWNVTVYDRTHAQHSFHSSIRTKDE
ncbi:MAG: trehalase family glycosidase [Candidatus Izemoplasmatales bacterium]